MLEILPNTCIFELTCWGCLLAIKLKMYLKKHSKSTWCSWINVAKKWAVVTLLKALPLVHFSRRLLLKEQMKISVVVKQIAKRLLYFFRSKSQRVVQLAIICKKKQESAVPYFLSVVAFWCLSTDCCILWLANSANYRKVFKDAHTSAKTTTTDFLQSHLRRWL